MPTWLYVALIAHFLYALVFVFDKYILSKPIKSSLSYAFYTSFAGGFIAIIIPFFDFRVFGSLDYFFLGVFFFFFFFFFFFLLFFTPFIFFSRAAGEKKKFAGGSKTPKIKKGN